MTTSAQTGIAPHGGRLVNRVVSPEQQAEARSRTARLPELELNARSASDLLLLATGAFSPLEGFMDLPTAHSVVEEMRLPSGMLWPLPVLLQADLVSVAAILPGHEVVLRYGKVSLGTLEVEDKFAIPLRNWAAKIFQTTDETHPGVKAFLSGGEVALAGRINWFGDPCVAGGDRHWLTPEETRAQIAQRGWQSVAGFQTRNPIHRAHEYVLRIALEITDGLLLHPLVGETQPEDLPAALRIRCYQAVLDHYLPRDRVLFSVIPAWMRYAGPREAVFHALVRKNFGCTHFLVGRDHAGVGQFYSPYDAHHLLRSVAVEDLGIQPLFFDEVFYCRRCRSMASRRTCPHPDSEHLTLSGTQVRRRLQEGLPLPEEFVRPEVAAVLAEAFRSARADSDE